MRVFFQKYFAVHELWAAQSNSTLFTLIVLAEMAKLAVFGCLEKYLFTLFCFELRLAQNSEITL